MVKTPSQTPIERQALGRMENRISFLYIERAVVNRSGNALTITDERGTAHVPATQISVVLLGPGTKITHAAIALLGDSGTSTVWVGVNGVRYYAHGRSPARSSTMAEAQVKVWSNQRARLRCARRMYEMRFPNEDVSRLTMQQLRGREGYRVKNIYVREAARTGIPWDKRSYDPHDFDTGDDINKALSEGAAALYGVAYAVITGLGFIPSLGIVHTGTDSSFVYDIADLYKAEISIPAAFEATAQTWAGEPVSVRHVIRDKIVSTRLIPRMIHDLQELMNIPEELSTDCGDLFLWDELQAVPAGVNYEEQTAS
ncbi:type I-E CRISPR-associated endonuclease Cas1e [Lawsonella clevelandensis]|uniref:type I-E CRISPR-associated endonuclease Cas1e n=1 Tax=Lawsonella clevelandensis TaxID=1528099 RepID=UPI000AB93F01|nr:type I-E CRISPR-associated endonuclease Cas1e [Lawsonella clevelandensis]